MDTMSMHISCSGYSHEQRDTILGGEGDEASELVTTPSSTKSYDKPEMRKVFI
jgi:hypothetical protein